MFAAVLTPTVIDMQVEFDLMKTGTNQIWFERHQDHLSQLLFRFPIEGQKISMVYLCAVALLYLILDLHEPFFYPSPSYRDSYIIPQVFDPVQQFHQSLGMMQLPDNSMSHEDIYYNCWNLLNVPYSIHSTMDYGCLKISKRIVYHYNGR